ncbi:hypothetical protein FBU30_011214 [Linnemannia zychae]|nr:hypothetical protein FBU30_011214 [Linnemannia zychae]
MYQAQALAQQNVHGSAPAASPQDPQTRPTSYQQQQYSTAQTLAAAPPIPSTQGQQTQWYTHQETNSPPQKTEHYPPQKPLRQEQHRLSQRHQPQRQEQAELEQEEPLLPPTREFTIVALGKSGEGKSTLLNSILGREIFLAKASVNEVTQHVDKATNHFLNIPSNPIMHCIDTPSFNGKLHDPNRVKEIGALLTKVAAGVDAFLFTIKCTRYRFDSTFYHTLLTYQSLLTPAFWSKLILVFTHATPELLPSNPEARVPLMAWAREIQEKFKLSKPPKVVFVMDFARFPYPSGGAQDFWERLMELDADESTEPYCHKPFLESFGNGIAVEGYVQRIKGHLAVFEPRFFESQAEGQFKENQQLKKRGTEYRFGLFRKSTQATSRR